MTKRTWVAAISMLLTVAAALEAAAQAPPAPCAKALYKDNRPSHRG